MFAAVDSKVSSHLPALSQSGASGPFYNGHQMQKGGTFHVTQMFDESARTQRNSDESGVQSTPQASGVHLPPVASRSQQSIASLSQPAAPRASNSNPDVHDNAERQSRTQCMSPNTAMKLYMSKLTTYEHHEVFNFPQVSVLHFSSAFSSFRIAINFFLCPLYADLLCRSQR